MCADGKELQCDLDATGSGWRPVANFMNTAITLRFP